MKITWKNIKDGLIIIAVLLVLNAIAGLPIG